MEPRRAELTELEAPNPLTVTRLIRRLAERFGLRPVSGSDPFRPDTSAAPASQPDLECWRRELAGNELIRFPGWFEGSKTLDGVRAGVRVSLHPDGRYSFANRGKPKGNWVLQADSRGGVQLVLSPIKGEITVGGDLRFNADDPGAVYLNGKRYLRRFVRNHLILQPDQKGAGSVSDRSRSTPRSS